MKAVARSIPFIILVCGVVGLVGLSNLKKDPPSSHRDQLAPLVVHAIKFGGGYRAAVERALARYR